MTIDSGARRGHYVILSRIGAGGMGEVYLAQDTRLDRKIALKILPADVASNTDRMERFVREAKSAAALNHPHIAQVFEIGDHDGAHFIAMEFIDGVTLRDKIHRERAELKNLLKVLQQVAEGLSKAHAAGIVHRDLKPDNIMITRDGFAKVLDFGLAKLVEKSGPGLDESEGSNAPTNVMQQRSVPGMVMGTVGYMSPEQAQGKTNEIDQRSDVFSFGCILFEAITGKKAFEGDSVIKSLHSLIYEPAPRIKDLNPSAPADLQRIVERCLEKDPDERYQTIKDVGIELKHLRRGMTDAIEARGGSSLSTSQQASGYNSQDSSSESSPQTEPVAAPSTQPSSAEYVVQGLKRHKLGVAVALMISIAAVALFAYYLRAGKSEAAIDSIAVLPFENRSGNADTDYLSDGLADSLIYRLSQLPNLKVSPTSSVIGYRGKATDVAQIAKELEVDAVMSGRLVQRGDDLSISVQLIDSRTKKLIWAEQYDRKMTDLLATQREIATAITQKLQLQLAGDEAKGITKKYTDSNEAYQLYLKGRYHYAKRTRDDLNKGHEYFQQAVKLDPNFALAYAWIADSYASMPAYPYLSPKEAFPKSQAAAKRALEIDPTLPEAHTAMGYSLALYDWNWAEAEREFKRAIELDPKNSLSHVRFAICYYVPLGRLDEAIKENELAAELEPLNLVNGANLVWMYMLARRNDDALTQGRKVYDLEPDFVLGRYLLGLTYNANGMYQEAIALTEKPLQADPTNQGMLHVAGYAYAKSGRRNEANAIISRFKEISKTQYVISFYIATIYAGLGEDEKAFAELETAVQERDWRMSALLKVEPMLDTLREAPRFKELLKRLNLPE